MKRRIALFCALLAAAFTLLGQASAAESPVISGNTATAKPGESIDFSVRIDQNTGLAGFMIYIDCDRDIFFLEKTTDSEGYCITSADVTKTGTLTCTDHGTDGWTVVWYQPQNTSANGELFRLQLSVAEDAQPGEYPFSIRYSSANTVNETGARVALDTVDGCIRVLPEKATFSSAEIVSAPGNRFDLPVYIDANPGVASFVVYIDCDTNVFSLLEENGSYLLQAGSFADGGNYMVNTNGEKGFRVIWFNNNESTKSGALFTLPLMVSEEAELGAYGFEIRVSAADLCDAKGNAVPIESVAGGAVALELIEIANVGWRSNSQSRKDEVIIQTHCLHTKKPTLLCAAVYTSGGKMREMQTLEVKGRGAAEQFVIPLAGDLTPEQTVKIFALSGEGYIPLTACQAFPATSQYEAGGES